MTYLFIHLLNDVCFTKSYMVILMEKCIGKRHTAKSVFSEIHKQIWCGIIIVASHCVSRSMTVSDLFSVHLTRFQIYIFMFKAAIQSFDSRRLQPHSGSPAHFTAGLIACLSVAKSLTAAALAEKVCALPPWSYFILSLTTIFAFSGSMMTSYKFIYFIQIAYQKAWFIISLRSPQMDFRCFFLLNKN